MKITEHTKRRGGGRYWIASPECPEDKEFLEVVGKGLDWTPAKFAGFINRDNLRVGETIGLLKDAGQLPRVETDSNDIEEGEDNMDFSAMKVPELRKLVRDNGWTGAEVLNASKVELVHFLETGEKPARGNGEVNMADIGAKLAELIGQLGGTNGVDPEAVRDIVKEEMGNAVKRIQVTALDKQAVDVGIQHKIFEKLLKLGAARVKAMIVGPAGSGKTHVCHAVADALGIAFYPYSVGAMTTDSKLLGYMDANGKYVATSLYAAYKEGGLYLLDEIDAGNANVITALNALLANGGYTFPNSEYVEQHKDFICFAAANTYGRGADRQYVGRNQLDAASLDRFAVVNMDYDEQLETQLAGNKEWTDRVQAYRKSANDLKERVVISPRASIEGAKLLAIGFPVNEVEDMTIWKGIDKAIIEKIKSRTGY